jgi:LAS superfamily LD-carboxypeptidase LdcB
MNIIEEISTGNFDGEVIKYAGITHYKFSDCKLENLVTCCGKRVHKQLAKAFRQMRKAAKKDGIDLVIVSGFRSIHYQKSIFPYKFKNKKHPTEKEFISRLQFSAPAGFSEHHTGLAVDINSLEQDFAQTKEYEWLKAHANDFGFEMSFPENNSQGLGFEPWHWRFVGTNETKKIFVDHIKN